MAKELILFNECRGEVVSVRPLSQTPHGQVLLKINSSVGSPFRDFLIDSREIDYQEPINSLVGKFVKVSISGLSVI